MHIAQLFAPPVWWSLLGILFTLLLPFTLLSAVVVLCLALVQKPDPRLVAAAKAVFLLGVFNGSLLVLWLHRLSGANAREVCPVLITPGLALIAWWRSRVALKPPQTPTERV